MLSKFWTVGIWWAHCAFRYLVYFEQANINKQGILCCLAFSLFSCFFSPVSIVITSFGEERERAGLCTSRAFVYFACIDFCPSFPPGVGGWLWLVTVALPGLFVLTFLTFTQMMGTTELVSLTMIMYIIITQSWHVL